MVQNRKFVVELRKNNAILFQNVSMPFKVHFKQSLTAENIPVITGRFFEFTIGKCFGTNIKFRCHPLEEIYKTYKSLEKMITWVKWLLLYGLSVCPFT